MHSYTCAEAAVDVVLMHFDWRKLKKFRQESFRVLYQLSCRLNHTL